MGNGYSAPQGDGMDILTQQVRSILARLRELETMRGSQIYESVKELRALVENLEAEIAAVSSSGATWFGPVATTGTVTANTMLNSVGAYNNDITATRRGAWWRSNGDAGYASSSIHKKHILDGIEAPDILALLEATAVSTYYQYLAELDKRDNPDNEEYDPDYHVATEWGGIAQWFHELGLWQVVVYEDHSDPVGLHYEIMGLLGIETSRFVWRELKEYRAATDARLAAIEAALGI
jgi:hypothetical protein